MNSRTLIALAAPLALFAFAAPLWAELPSLAAGGSVTVGSHDYSGVKLSGDADWKVEDLSPYVRAEIMSDTFLQAVTVGGGTWKTLKDGLEVKGGLALTTARIKGADESGESVTLELGAEQSVGEPVLGAEYRLTSGSVGTSPSGRISGGRFSRPGGFGRNGDPETFTSNEVAAYGRMTSGTATLGLRLALYVPSDSDNVLSETASVSVPLSEQLSASAALSLEQADHGDGVYLTVGIRCKF